MPSIIKNGVEYSASPTSLNNLTDTNISSPVGGQVLTYNASNSMWGNSSVVESGSNTNGNYIKWADGTMICTKSASVTVESSWSDWGSMKYVGSLSLGSFPQTFIATPVISASLNGDSAWIERIINTSTKYTGDISFIRPNDPGRTTNFTVPIIAIGRWKA